MPIETVLRRGGLYERHLDLVLAEELAVNHRLVRWFFCKCFDDAVGEIVESTTSTGAWDGQATSDARGETNVVVEILLVDGRRRRLLIEDRLDGLVDQRHAEGYRRRADLATRAGLPTRAVMVAPAASLGSRSMIVRAFHAEMSIEAIAAELRGQAGQLVGELARRLLWRADTLDVLRSVRPAPPSNPRRVSFAQWFVDRLAVVAPRVLVDRSALRTTSTGWLYLTLREQLIYKVEWGLLHLYIRDIDGVDDDITVTEATRRVGTSLPAGFSVSRDKSDRNTVIEISVGAMPLDECVDADGPTSEYLPTFERAASAIVELSSWLAVTGRRRLGSASPSSSRDDESASSRARADGHPSTG